MSGVLLALDLSAESCTLALGADPGLRVIGERDFSEGRGRAIISELEALLEASGVARESVRGVIVGIGPGSYTGLRIACTAARTLAWALEIPCVGLPSFAAAAFSAPPDREVHLLLNAFRGEVYHACYARSANDVVERVAPRVLTREQALSAVPAGALLLGDASLSHNSVTVLRPGTAPRASELLALAHARGARSDGRGMEGLGPARPLYLRPAAFPPRPA